MREILYKAKRITDGEWIYGSYVYTFCEDKNCPVVGVKVEKYWIVEESGNMVWVYEDTICQCTGLKDKNGKLIWENDIVIDDNGNLYKAFWQDRYYQFSWICVKSDKLPIGAKWDFWSIRSYEIDVIGNIFDNPELMHE